jgi:hypothetical protein
MIMQDAKHKINHALEVILPQTAPYHKIIADLYNGMDEADFPNVLIYGYEGFPHTVLWDIALLSKHGSFRRQTCTWEKQWVYSETPYFFELDFMNPGQPKDIESLADFFKEILRHPCIHATRHVFVLKHIDVLCTRGYVYMLRVILERFSKNALFVCTTYHVSSIESPIRSRFLLMRVPLLTAKQVQEIFTRAEITLHPDCVKQEITDLNVATFLSVVDTEALPYPAKDFCKFQAPFLQDILKLPSPSISQIRNVTQKLSVHGYSLSQITQDLLQYVKPKDFHDFLHKAVEIEHMYVCTEKYRKPLYIELLLHTAIYGYIHRK